MAEIMIKGNGVTSMGSIDGWSDLRPRPGFNINPPPADGRCECCGRSLDELKPFGKAGDPLVGDFSDALLVKKFRTTYPPDAEVDKIYDQFFGECCTEDDHERAKKRLIKEHGQEEAERIMGWADASSCIGASWECRDCAVLDIYEYHEKLRERLSKEQG
ncbi:MAG: hypothetical protein GTN76_16370 [Candidatus Aenigmarchaeota archaeon]|nr:hypothetical protein [Candidatus Aenigmarchaeota archaeon]